MVLYEVQFQGRENELSHSPLDGVRDAQCTNQTPGGASGSLQTVQDGGALGLRGHRVPTLLEYAELAGK